VRNDQGLAGGGAGAVHGFPDRGLDPLAAERIPAGHQTVPVWFGLAKQLGGSPHTGLGSRLGAADPGELGLALDPSARLEQLAVDRQLDPVAPAMLSARRTAASRTARRGSTTIAAPSIKERSTWTCA
jgi:hypothetical protein